MGVSVQAPELEIAVQGIEKMEVFFREINMPVSLSQLNVFPTEIQLQDMAHKCSLASADALGSAKVLHETDMLAIYREACK